MPPAARARTRSSDGPGEHDPEASVRPGLGAHLLGRRALLRRAQPEGLVEEGLLDRRELGRRHVVPLQQAGQAHSAVQLAVRSAHRVPGVRGAGEVVQDPLALHVVVEPPAQARPLSGQGLVGEGDVAVVAGEQPRPHQQLDESLLLGTGHDPVPGDADPRGLALGTGGHQSHEQVAELVALLERHVDVHRLGGLRDRATHTPGGEVPVDGEGATFAPVPRLHQRVRQQGEGAGLVQDLAEQEVDQPGFDEEPRLPGRPLDRGPQPGGVHGVEQVPAALQETGQLGLRGELGRPVGAQRHDQLASASPADERVEVGGSMLGGDARREDLLQLVDDEDGPDRGARHGVRLARPGAARETRRSPRVRPLAATPRSQRAAGRTSRFRTGRRPRARRGRAGGGGTRRSRCRVRRTTHDPRPRTPSGPATDTSSPGRTRPTP